VKNVRLCIEEMMKTDDMVSFIKSI